MLIFYPRPQMTFGAKVHVAADRIDFTAYVDEEKREELPVAPSEDGKPTNAPPATRVSFVRREVPSTILLNEFKSLAAWGDYGLWACLIDPSQLALSRPRNVFAETLAGREPVDLWANRLGQVIALSISVPHRDANFLDCSIRVSSSETFDLQSNLPYTRVGVGNAKAGFEAVMPKLVLEGPEAIAPGAVAMIRIRASLPGAAHFKTPLVSHLETVGGYLPTPRVEVPSSGVAEFPVMALGLVPGNKVRVKAGFRFFPGLTELTIPVRA